MAHGSKTKLAKLVGITYMNLWLYLAGRRNASAPIADRLATLTGTDIRVWLQGGSPEARQAAVEAWAAAQESATRKPCRPGRFGVIGRPGEQNGPSAQGETPALPGEPEPAGAFT